MENLGYKEGTANRRRTIRSISVLNNNEAEQQPLTGIKNDVGKRLKPNPSNLTMRLGKKSDAILEAQFATADATEYMECGPSPPAEGVPNMHEMYEKSTTELNEQLCSDTLRMSLIEQMNNAAGRVRFMEDIEQGNVIAENISTHFESASTIEKNLSFLWAAFLKRWDLLEGFYGIGSELGYCDQNGIGALHLGAFSGCLSTLSFLLEKQANVDLQPGSYTPLHCAAFGNSVEAAKMLVNKGASLTLNTKTPNCEENLLQCAVRSHAVECLQYFVDLGADVNSLKPNGTNAIHLAADLANAQCLAVLLKAPGADPNVRICIREKEIESTALHLAADEGDMDCVNLLLAKGADAKLKNRRGFSALHLAARTSSLGCVDSLLRHGNADPNAVDFDNRTPLHAAIGKSDHAYEIIEVLIQWGANVNHKDKYGCTALHLAALDGLPQCVEVLIYYDSNVSTKSKKGITALNVITRKTPASMAMVWQKLDSAITLRPSKDPVNNEVELELDFRQLLQHCHPREINHLNTFVNEGQKDILAHPLCSAFLHVKWAKIRKYYIGRLIFCFVFVLFLSLYALTTLVHNCYKENKDDSTVERELCQSQSMLGDMLRQNPFVMEMQWWVLVAITIVEILRKLTGITAYASFRHYIMQVENIMEWIVIISVFAISYIYTKQTYTFQNHIGAFAVLLGWTNLMLMIGQLPVFDVYVAMYTKVQGEFAKVFVAYACMLIGFTFSFCVIFPSSSMFANPLMGFISVLVMMIGELETDMLTNDPNGEDPPVILEVSAQITFVLFMLTVSVVLMNLLVGIAVHDIQGLKKTAGLSKLVRQTKLISYIESALFNGYLPAWLRKFLHHSALISPKAYRVVLCVKPLNPCENRLPRDVLMKAYEIAKMRQQSGVTGSPKFSTDTYEYLSYKSKYSNTKSAGQTDGMAPIQYTALSSKIDESAARVEYLRQGVRELKQALIVQQQQSSKVIDQLLIVISNQQNTNSSP